MKFFARLLLIFLVLFPRVHAQDSLAPSEVGRHIARLVISGMPQVHMTHDPLSEGLARRTLENFLRALDFDRTIFTAEDIVLLRQQAADLEKSLAEGDLEFAYSAFELYRQRAADRVAFVHRLLEEGLPSESEGEYVWRRKDAPWAADDREWDDLWRQKITHEYLGALVSRRLREKDAAEKAQKKADAAPEASPAPEEASPPPPAPKAPDLSPQEVLRKRYDQFLEMLKGHDAEYVLQMYLNSLTTAYDVHSSYFSPRSEEDFDIQMKLSLTGIGAILQYDEGAAKIERLSKGGPAERDGRLQPGDKIIAVGQGDGEEPVSILFWPLYRSVRLIRGPIGSKVVLHVIPASDPSGSEVKVIEIVRDEIKLEEKAAHAIVHELQRDGATLRLGILNLPDFYADFDGRRENGEAARSCATDVRRLLLEFNDKEVDGMILDLRNNGGGSLQDCVAMSGFFIDAGPVVQVKSERVVRPLNDPERGVLFDKPLVVMVNRLSASASEILAAALQDYGRAVIVGDSKTHGKGSVQSLLPVDPGDSSLGSLKVTTAAFYRVDGRSTQLKGVAPDLVLRSPSDVMELGEEYLDNVLPWSWVKPARHRPFADLRATNAELRKRSEARRAGDEEFKAYQEQIDRLEERVQRRTAPLSLSLRLEQALEDRELDKMRGNGLALDEEEEGEEDGAQIRPDKDILLREALQILADLVEISSSAASAPAAQNVSAKGVLP